MQNNFLNINCIKSFTVIRSDSKIRVTDECLCVGYDNAGIYKGFLYFDISKIPQNITLNTATLRLYVNNTDISEQYCMLYFQPLLCDSHNPKIFQSTNNCCGCQIPVKVEKDFQGWLDIDIYGIVKNWYSKTTDNYGLIISIDKCEHSLLTFFGTEFLSCQSVPLLILNNSVNCQAPVETGVRIKEEYWRFKFYKTVVSPPINVSLIKQATFYVTNKGSSAITVAVETSADLFCWVKDSYKVIKECSTKAIVAKYYGKFYRLKVFAGGHGIAETVFVGQFYN